MWLESNLMKMNNRRGLFIPMEAREGTNLSKARETLGYR